MKRLRLVASLDFVSIEEDRIILWANADYPSWSEGCRIGRHRADQIVAFMRQHNDTVIFDRIAQQAVRGGILDATRVGFIHRISERLLTRQ